MTTSVEDSRPDLLGTDIEELKKLNRWIYAYDRQWLADALWLRYVKIAPAIYSRHPYGVHASVKLSEEAMGKLPFSDGGRNGRETGLPSPPIPFTVLPELPPVDGRDRLSSLNHDLRFEILSYLFRPGERDARPERPELVSSWNLPGCDHRALLLSAGRQAETRNLGIGGRDLNRMALVSRCWRGHVEAFCGHALLVWKQKVEARHFDAQVRDWVEGWKEWEELETFTTCARMEFVWRARKYCALRGRNCQGSWRTLAPGLKLCERGCEDDKPWCGGGY